MTVTKLALTINLQKGLRFVSNDFQANQAFQQGQAVTLHLRSGDLVLVKEMLGPSRGPTKPKHSGPQGIWLGAVSKTIQIQCQCCHEPALASAICVDRLSSELPEDKGPLWCLYPEDEIIVLYRNGRPCFPISEKNDG